VQSTTDYADLGVATSGVSFLRTMGSSFGVAVFGTIYASELPDRLPEVRLRDTARASADGNSGVGESFAAPASTTSQQELKKLVGQIWRKQHINPGPELLARAGTPLIEAQGWLIDTGHTLTSGRHASLAP